MSTRTTLDKICVVIVVCSLLLTVLFINGQALGLTKIVDEDADQNSDTEYFTSKDQDGNWDSSEATVITLAGDEAVISGNGAYTNDGNVVIKNAGYYVVSGTLTDGYLSVDAYDSSKVFIRLDGVEINCSDDACIRVDQADKVFLTLAEGSLNTLTSGSTYSEQALKDGTDGAIFAHDDLTINGSGSLTINAEYRHGIAANDDLVITGGTITVTAAADAIHAKDSIRIKEASSLWKPEMTASSPPTKWKTATCTSSQAQWTLLLRTTRSTRPATSPLPADRSRLIPAMTGSTRIPPSAFRTEPLQLRSATKDLKR
jgi:hypothetical protein